MQENTNKKLYELSKKYAFEYELLVEKVKVHRKNPNELPKGSINESANNIRSIKDEMLGMLITELTDENNNNTPELKKTPEKPSFKMEF